MEHIVLSFCPPPETVSPEVYRLWAAAKTLAVTIQRETPPGREQALALTKLEEAAMWAAKAVTTPRQETLL